jgi:hypothetical protein
MPSPITSGENDGTEVSLRKAVAILSGSTPNSHPNDSTEVSLRKIVQLLGEGNAFGGSSSTFTLSQTTYGGSGYLLGERPALLPGDTIIISGSIVAVDTKTDKSKTWKVEGTVSQTQSGNYQQSSPITFTPSGIGPMSVTFSLPLEFFVHPNTNNKVEWKALFSYGLVRAIASNRVAGCIDALCSNYNANAQEDNGSCSYNLGVAENTSQIVPVSIPDDILITFFYVEDTDHNTSIFGPSLAESVNEDNRVFYFFDATQNLKIGDNVNYKLKYLSPDLPGNGYTNGEITGSIKIGQTLKVSFYAAPYGDDRTYYVNFLPRGVRPLYTLWNHEPDYNSLYLTASDMWNGDITNKGYYIIYNQLGVPVWYARTNKRPLSLHLGCSANRLITNYYNPVEKNYAIDIKSTKYDKTVLTTKPTSSGDAAPSWDHHETYEISGPAFRRGNIVAVSYSFGFYIQEISPEGSLVWDWKATDYFNSSNPEVYHLNSVDVHPVTGKYLVSLRNVDAIICIDFDSKAVDWILSDNSQLNELAKTNILWMQPSPFIESCGFAKQHDARWLTFPHIENSGFLAISLYDNGPGNRNSRAIAMRFRPYSYRPDAEEFDLELLALFNTDVASPYTGSYRIWKDEITGKFHHTLQVTASLGSFVEYQTSENFFEVDFNDAIVVLADFIYTDPENPIDYRNKEYYRFIPVPHGQLRLENLLATSGKVLEGSVPSAGLLFRWSGSSYTNGENGLVLLDESGNGFNSNLLSEQNDFTVFPNAINGQPAIWIPGNSILGADVPLSIGSSTPLTLVGVIQPGTPPGGSGNARWFGTNSQADKYIATFTSGSYGNLASSSAMFGVSYVCDIDHESVPLSENGAETRILIYTQDETSSKFYLNGNLVSTLTEKNVVECIASEAPAAEGFIFGGMAGNVLGGYGLVGEVMAYNRVLDGEDLTNLVSSLKAKYGIS